jgi:hypothetical protein
MNFKYLFLHVMILLPAIAFSQKHIMQNSDAAFCGKTGESGPAPQGSYAVEELRNCDFKIIPLDTDLTVIEFRLSMYSKNNQCLLSEKLIEGNTIPEVFRQSIVSDIKTILLEHVKAVDKKGAMVNIKPIGIRIQN